MSKQEEESLRGLIEHKITTLEAFLKAKNSYEHAARELEVFFYTQEIARREDGAPEERLSQRSESG